MTVHTAARPRFSMREQLRGETGPAHERLDAAFASYDLTAADDYARFLTAHARALLPLERALAPIAPWSAWAPRGDKLRQDLAALGLPEPAPLPVPPIADAAEAWGMLYVLEGSRLGGVLLNGQVGAGLPHAYLAQVHGAGEWRAFLSAMEAAEIDAAAALRGAQAAFALFAEAAAVEGRA